MYRFISTRACGSTDFAFSDIKNILKAIPFPFIPSASLRLLTENNITPNSKSFVNKSLATSSACDFFVLNYGNVQLVTVWMQAWKEKNPQLNERIKQKWQKCAEHDFMRWILLHCFHFHFGVFFCFKHPIVDVHCVLSSPFSCWIASPSKHSNNPFHVSI